MFALGLLSDYKDGKFSDSQAPLNSDNLPKMDTAEKTFQALVEAGLAPYDGKPFAAERALDLPQDSIRSLFRGDRKAGTSLNRAKEICDALGLELYIGPPRAQPTARGMAEAARAYLTVDGDAGAFDQGFLPIPYHRSDPNHRDLSHVALSRAWLEGKNLDPDRLLAVVTQTDDMAPAFYPGTLLLIDTGAEVEPEAQIMAFTVNGRMHVGWLILPAAGCLVAFFSRPYSPPVAMKGKSGPRIEPLGRVVARLDLDPGPWMDKEEKRRLLDAAKQMVKG